jgi:Uma2 family endonuclease
VLAEDGYDACHGVTNIVLRKPAMSLDQFLAWEDQQEERWEFDGHGPVAMVGGTLRHNIISGNLDAAFRRQLRAPCRAYRETLRFRTSRGTIRYPDLVVVCSRVQPSATEVPDPTIVFEILSTSTSRTDRVAKMLEYQATPSVMRYVLLEQDEIAATVVRRVNDTWATAVLVGATQLELPELGAQVSLPELYADTEVEDDQATPSA